MDEHTQIVDSEVEFAHSSTSPFFIHPIQKSIIMQSTLFLLFRRMNKKPIGNSVGKEGVFKARREVNGKRYF